MIGDSSQNKDKNFINKLLNLFCDSKGVMGGGDSGL